MRRLFVALAAFLSIFSLCFAQPKISSGNSSVDITVKRALVVGNDVVIDIVITCHNGWNSIELLGHDDGVWAPIVFDDEGNVYKGTGMSGRLAYEADGSRQYYNRGLDVTRDVPRKFRLVVKHVDEYATSFASIKIPYFGNGSNGTTYTMIIKNLPITRE
ncbi:MAG: hypothetical protein IJU74_02415 [Bacteroidales bacterium]|nr:hypothetical protein [Bacteroidales bacterium]